MYKVYNIKYQEFCNKCGLHFNGFITIRKLKKYFQIRQFIIMITNIKLPDEVEVPICFPQN